MEMETYVHISAKTVINLIYKDLPIEYRYRITVNYTEHFMTPTSVIDSTCPYNVVFFCSVVTVGSDISTRCHVLFPYRKLYGYNVRI